jgi:tetratricopeptide (TPR) repeat protein
MITSDKKRWQEILQQQSIANAKRWLLLINENPDPALFVANDYENVLRALESTLNSIKSYELCFQLIQALHDIVIDFADWDRWLIYLEKALHLSEKSGMHHDSAKLYEQIGDIQYRMGHLEKAEDYLLNASERYRLLESLTDYAHTLAKLGVLYDLQGKMDDGINLCLDALEITEAANDIWGIAQVNLNLSHIYQRARNWERSHETAQKSFNYFELLNRPKEATKALINLVAISAELGNWQEVGSLSQHLMDNLIASEDIRTLSQLKNNLGIAAFNQNNFQVAEVYWQEALSLHSQIQEPSTLASLYNNLGMVYTKINEFEYAEKMLNKAIGSYKAIGDVYRWANSMDNLADLYEVQGKTAVFKATLQSAIDGLQSIKEIPHAQQLLDNMAQRIRSPRS